MAPKNVATSLQIPRQMYEILEREAKARYLSNNKFINMILADFVRKKRFDIPKESVAALVEHTELSEEADD